MVEKLIKNLIPLAIIIAGILIAGAIVYINQGKSGILSPQTAAEKAIEYINQNMLQEGISASLINAVEENGIYKFRFKIMDREFDSYVTKNGKILFIEGIDLEEKPIVQEPEGASEPPTETSVPPEELARFIDCLKKNNFVIYGANWCGWTKKLVETLGGWDMVEPIYMECTEKTEICEEKGVKAYPTILIGGEQYQGARTFEEIAKATGCEKPLGAESVTGESQGGCQ